GSVALMKRADPCLFLARSPARKEPSFLLVTQAEPVGIPPPTAHATVSSTFPLGSTPTRSLPRLPPNTGKAGIMRGDCSGRLYPLIGLLLRIFGRKKRDTALFERLIRTPVK